MSESYISQLYYVKQVNQEIKALLLNFAVGPVNRFEKKPIKCYESKQLFSIWWKIYKDSKSLNQQMLKEK